MDIYRRTPTFLQTAGDKITSSPIRELSYRLTWGKTEEGKSELENVKVLASYGDNKKIEVYQNNIEATNKSNKRKGGY